MKLFTEDGQEFNIESLPVHAGGLLVASSDRLGKLNNLVSALSMIFPDALTIGVQNSVTVQSLSAEDLAQMGLVRVGTLTPGHPDSCTCPNCGHAWNAANYEKCCNPAEAPCNKCVDSWDWSDQVVHVAPHNDATLPV